MFHVKHFDDWFGDLPAGIANNAVQIYNLCYVPPALDRRIDPDRLELA